MKKEREAKYQSDRKKWQEEKEGLLDQVKEAENLRNREMKKFAEDRQRHGKQQAEIVSDEVLAESSSVCSLETTSCQVLTVWARKSRLSKSP